MVSAFGSINPLRTKGGVSEATAVTYKATIDKFRLKVEKSLRANTQFDNADPVIRHLVKIALLSCNRMTNRAYDKAYVR